MPDMPEAPPLRWLFAGVEQRRLAWRYWVTDVGIGLLNVTVHYALRLLPIDLCSRFGGAMGQFAKYRYLDSDARARKLWAKLRPQESDPTTVDAAMRRLWRNVGRTMAEFSVLDRLWKAGRIAVEGEAFFDSVRQSGRPIIFLGLHLGNWETIPVTVLAHGFRGGSVALMPENRFDNFIARRARDRLGGRYYLVASRKTGFEAVDLLLLKKQQLLMYVDEFVRGRVWAPAFGRRLQTRGNIANILRLARITDALILPLYSVRVDDRARFRVTVLPPFEPVRTGDRVADLEANIAAIDRLIDPIIRAHLDQWYYALDFEFDS